MRSETPISDAIWDEAKDCACDDMPFHKAMDSHEKLELALAKIIKACDTEWRAWQTAQVAKENYTNPEPDVNAHEQAKIALYDAINDAKRESARIESELKG